MANLLQKEEAHKLVENMPPNATWDDLIHEIYVRGAIEKGLSDSTASRAQEVGKVRAKYGLGR